MHNPQADKLNMRPEDFWCDFCRSAWREDLPMVEGHHGSLICGRCLTVAYGELILLKGGEASGGAGGGGGVTCTLCLEERRERVWRSPAHEEAAACTRCVRQAATALDRDAESGWKKPAAPGA
ncbi:MAG: hypothetical protein IBJ11_08090 [Phycisphaerales bacterium]|nr:hypothetical protein [Phycisphaerales bacterium]